MKAAVFSTKSYDEEFLRDANERLREGNGGGHDLTFLEARLSAESATLAQGYESVVTFVNDTLDRPALEHLAEGGTRLVAQRSAGFNNVDLHAARDVGITVARVPAYSPYAVAEHTVGLLLALNRRIHRAYPRVRDGNFALHGLLGFDLHGKTVGVVGTGRIGRVFAGIMAGFGCRLLGSDPYPNDAAREIGVEYTSMEELLGASDVVALFAPLTPETYHLIDAEALRHARPGMILVNTSRGALVDTAAVIDALKDERLGGLAIDVYEEEADVFFEDLSDRVLQDDVLARLLTFPNVLVTAHQAFFTREALRQIADTTVGNLSSFERDGRTDNDVEPPE